MEFEGQYLTYEEYRALGGTLDLMSFNLLEFRSRKEIDNRTQSRLKKLSNQVQEVKICDFDLINKINKFINSEERNLNISSESTNGYSVTYNDISKEFTDIQKKDIVKTIDNYLEECKLDNGVPYLYRG
jgi:hypothetical protein